MGKYFRGIWSFRASFVLFGSAFFYLFLSLGNDSFAAPRCISAVDRRPTQFDAAHDAISTDLFNGRTIAGGRFSADNNRTEIYRATIKNQLNGRTRDALFKPRPFGDGGGWNRTPMEYVAYELNLALGMDYVPPTAYRRGFDVDYKHFAEGALIYWVDDTHSLANVPVKQWGESKELFLSDTRILDVLLQNCDRHINNFKRGKHWVDGSYKPVLLDFSAGLKPDSFVRMDQNNAFGTGPTLVIRERTWLKLKKLSLDYLRKKFPEFISEEEMQKIMLYRAEILEYFKDRIQKHGYKNVVKN